MDQTKKYLLEKKLISQRSSKTLVDQWINRNFEINESVDQYKYKL